MNNLNIFFQKSWILFSTRVEDDITTQLTRILGISRATNLGRYLGILSIHGRVVKMEHFSGVFSEGDCQA